MLKRATTAFVLLTLGSTLPALAGAGFVRSSNMTFGRASFPAVVLPDGRVLVASSNTAERYDPTTGSFTSAGTMTTNRGGGLTATKLPNGTVLIAGGQSFGGSLASAEIFHPAAGTFTPTGSMSTPRSAHTATLLGDGRVLITGGSRFGHPSSALASAEVYDPSAGAFTLQGSMSVVRQDHTATLLPDGRVLIAGGYDNFSLGLSSAELYDPATGSFTETGSMTAGRANHTATLLGNGKVVVAGGHTSFPGGSLASAEIYDPGTGSFAPTGDMTTLRGSHTATSLPDGTLLIAGGFTDFPFGGTTLSSAEVYDPNTGSFASTAGMHGARGRHAAAALPSGEILVAGGIDQCCGSGLVSAEVFSLSLVDTQPPDITVPADITVGASSPEGALVSFDVIAVDDIDPDPELSCEPPSGSTFPLGTTTVVCTATDDAGNTATAHFDVVVLGPLDIAIAIDSAGLVHPTTGLATLSGTVTCNRPTQSGISIELSQTIAGTVLRGFSSRAFSCVPPSLAWIGSVSAANGRFRTGNAQAIVSGEFCDQFGCDSDEVTATVQLLPRSPSFNAVTLTKVAETRTVTPEGIGPFGGLSAPFVRNGVAIFKGEGPGLSQGLYSGSGGALTVMADTSTPVPGGAGNFTRLDSPTFDGATLAFQGFDASQNPGLYTVRAGDVTRIADHQTPVPGGVGAFGGFIGPVLGGGKVAFRGSSEPSPFFAFGVYAADDAALTVIADRQTQIPGGTGNFGFFDEPAIHESTVVFRAGGSGEEGIYSSTEGAMSVVADRNTPIPGGSGPFRFFGASAVGDGLVAFTAADSFFRPGIYKSAEGTLTKVADTMTPVPFQSSNFGAFGPPVIEGSIMAFAALKQPFGSAGIYASEGETLTPIADVNTPAPGDQGNLIWFGGPALAEGNVAFLGQDSTGSQGIYARLGGTLRKVISRTDTLDGKDVSFFEFATGGACDFSGCPRGFGTGFDGSRLAFLATFSDGSQGIYLATESEAATGLWVGLKNSDDQGTQFDVRADLYVNNALVAEGLTRCVTGITRNPAQAKEVLVPFGPILNGGIVSGDVLSLKVFTRIGTNLDGSKCPGHGNAVGLRLYYDGASQPSRFGAEIAPAPWTAYFLHSNGSAFFLSTASPTSTQAKQKDSGPVKFAGGNPWVGIGTWSRVVP